MCDDGGGGGDGEEEEEQEEEEEERFLHSELRLEPFRRNRNLPTEAWFHQENIFFRVIPNCFNRELFFFLYCLKAPKERDHSFLKLNLVHFVLQSISV